ncbi:hypothetical protein LLH00_16950 [bacterium]|nr:hypothetical protein [bacterium]
MILRACVLCCLLLGLTATRPARAFDWDSLPAGRWVSLPTTGEAAPKVFHGGAAIVPEKGLVLFIGSDTHAPTPLENGESNSVWRLDLESLTWSRDYEQDPKSGYRILPDSQCVTESGRPWAMHTFGDVDWDPTVGRVVVVSGPLHARFEPQERFPMFTGPNWWVSLKPSHWEYDPDTRAWQRLETGAPNVFACGTVFDPERRVMLAHNGTSTWELDRAAGRWVLYNAPSKPGWELNPVYDSFARRVLLLGNNSGDTTLYAYDSSVHRWNVTPVEGSTLPAHGAAVAYDTRNHVLLYLANDYQDQYFNPTGRSVTFIYHSQGCRWERLQIESPELYGMNFLMQYDPTRNVFLHFEKSRDSGDRLRVWAFRYR